MSDFFLSSSKFLRYSRLAHMFVFSKHELTTNEISWCIAGKLLTVSQARFFLHSKWLLGSFYEFQLVISNSFLLFVVGRSPHYARFRTRVNRICS